MSSELVYHYCSLEALKGIVESKTLWASSFRYMNDHSEVLVSQNALAENHDVLLGDLAASKAHQPLKRALKRVSAQELEFYIVSFCRQPDKLSQWRYYADNGKGVAIGFRRASFGGLLLKDVSYGGLAPGLTALCAALANGFTKDNRAFKHLCTRELIELIGLTKSEAFVEEDECRLIAFHDRHDPATKVRFRRSGNFLVPFVEIDLTPNWSERIEDVWLGPAIQDELATQSVRHFLHSNGVTDVTLSTSNAPFRPF